MKKIEEQLNADIIKFFEDIRFQSDNGKIQTLKLLMEKYIHLTTTEHLMDSSDLNRIISSAKQSFANENLKIHLGQNKTKVPPSDVANLFVIEATIGHLNRIDCLKRLPKFDKREDQYPED